MIKGTVALAVSKGTGMCNIGKAPKKRNIVDKSKGCPYVGPHVPSGKRDEGCSGHIHYIYATCVVYKKKINSISTF